MTYLHIFDMDGTLLKGTTASMEIARVLRCEEELVEMEGRFGRGEIDTRRFAQDIHRLWEKLTEDDVLTAFESSPFLTHIHEVCADIRDRGEYSIVVSMSPDFYARLLLRFGFDEVVASRFPPLPFASPIISENILTPEDKVHITETERRRRRVGINRCVAYGDSLSDAPLFQHLTRTVSVNGDEQISAAAALQYTGSSLLEAYSMARESMNSGGEPTDTRETDRRTVPGRTAEGE